MWIEVYDRVLRRQDSIEGALSNPKLERAVSPTYHLSRRHVDGILKTASE